MSRLGLIGKKIDYSFSRGYFNKKFELENLPFSYENFDLESISEFQLLLENNANIVAFNVTIPYKEKIMPYLSEIDETAKVIGAVNTIKVLENGKLKGFNTDYYGFKKSISPFLKSHHKQALILGTGGASKAVAYALKQLNIDFHYVSRAKKPHVKYTYDSLTSEILDQHQIIINCTPLGTFPNIELHPVIPYHAINDRHLLFDLIYNPSETTFLKKGKSQGAAICNGSDMLKYQAELAWEIWDLI
ncbi:MAG: shikimate dehydrogenase [Bacteroidota bacterium]